MRPSVPHREGRSAAHIAQRLPTLSPREREALDHILDAKGAKAAARDMGVAVSTAEKLRARVFEKLRVPNAEQAIIRMATGALSSPSLEKEQVDRVRQLSQQPDLSAREHFLLDLLLRFLPDADVIELPSLPQLTRRENEILQHLVLGESSRVAAAALGISPRTVEGFRARIFRKLGARNRADLARMVVGQSGHRGHAGR